MVATFVICDGLRNLKTNFIFPFLEERANINASRAEADRKSGHHVAEPAKARKNRYTEDIPVKERWYDNKEFRTVVQLSNQLDFGRPLAEWLGQRWHDHGNRAKSAGAREPGDRSSTARSHCQAHVYGPLFCNRPLIGKEKLYVWICLSSCK